MRLFWELSNYIYEYIHAYLNTVCNNIKVFRIFCLLPQTVGIYIYVNSGLGYSHTFQPVVSLKKY